MQLQDYKHNANRNNTTEKMVTSQKVCNGIKYYKKPAKDKITTTTTTKIKQMNTKSTLVIYNVLCENCLKVKICAEKCCWLPGWLGFYCCHTGKTLNTCIHKCPTMCGYVVKVCVTCRAPDA